VNAYPYLIERFSELKSIFLIISPLVVSYPVLKTLPIHVPLGYLAD